jgi:hypothetical protein
MRRPLASAALTLLACTLCLASGSAPKRSSGPGKELLDTACGSGLLLQRKDADSPDAAADDGDADGSIFGDSGLFGGGGDEGKKADKKSAAPAKKPKTKLLRPRTDDDKKDCREKASAFIGAHGGDFTAVPAPENLSAEQIEGSIDRVFGAAAGPAKKQLLKDLKGGDLAAKTAVVDKIFDGVGAAPLDDAAFGMTVATNLHALVKAGLILPGDVAAETRTPEEEAAAVAAGAAGAAAPKVPLDPKTPNDPLSPARKKALAAKAAVPSPNAIVPPKTFDPVPAEVLPVQAGPVRQFVRDAGAVVSDFVRGAPIASYEGYGTDPANVPDVTPLPPGTDQSISRELPEAVGITRRCAPGCYGTEKMIKLLVAMGGEFSAYYEGKRSMSVGGISRRGGGPFPPHVSHRKGIDADITFQHNGGAFDAYANAMIVAAVIRKIPDFHHINGREYILCDQSTHAAIGWGLDKLAEQNVLTRAQAERGKSVLVHWPNHRDHFHVRILP